ncbi:MAG: CoA-binding protein, partial [Gammaproteobacteria bacterium]|nr:CoA-binding protein [Gammaproteobacteria bacterium]
MSKHCLDPLLKPGSIALLGASDRPDSPGQVLARQVIDSDYRGEVYPVNPGYTTILGRDCYPDLASLPTNVDHVIIALGNEKLEQAMADTIAHGARAATIYSSAVLENDSEPDLKHRLHSMAAEANLAVCGANGMGFYNLEAGLFAGIFPRVEHIQQGGISYIAQSGSAFTTLCHNGRRLGFNLCVSSGNELSVSSASYMDWALAQDSTRAIALFLETVRDPETFVEVLEKAQR